MRRSTVFMLGSCPLSMAMAAALLAGCLSPGTVPGTDGGGNNPTPDLATGGNNPMPDLAMGGNTCFQATTMLDLSKAPGAGMAYPKPTLSWNCTDTTFVIDSNGIPPYTFVSTTPNPLMAVAHHYTITRNPQPATQTTALPLGYIGFAVNGMTFCSPSEAGIPVDSAYGDPVYNNLLEACFGHTSPQEYHYHAFLEKCLNATAIVERPWMNAEPDASKPSPVLGWAADGYPVYGPRECNDANCTSIVIAKSSFVKIGDPKTYASRAYQYQAHPGDNTYMDECNGHIGPKGDYHYHSTMTYPYIINCFHGTPQGLGGGMMMGGQDGGMPPADGGMTMGPKTCTQNSDCVGACPMGSKGCTCATTPMGKACIPTCTVDADCPTGMNGMKLFCRMGTCAP